MPDHEDPVPMDSPAPEVVPPGDAQIDAQLAEGDGAAAAPVVSPADAGFDAVPAEDGSVTRVARLVVKRNGAETDETFPLHSPATIGRFDPAVGPIDVDLAPLPEGQYVSRKHARLTESGGVWTVTDLGSSNGTFVLRDGDFARAESAELADGDEFALGNARFVLRLS